MSISVISIGKAISKVVISMASLVKDSPLKEMAQNEYKMALCSLNSLSLVKDEQAIREIINNAICHLESSFINFPITTWDVWDKDTALWDKKTFANSICLHISILHYMLGNYQIAKKWLLENLDTMGSVYFPKNVLNSLSINNATDYYKAIAGKEYTKIEDLIQQSERNYDRIFDIDADGLLRYGGALYSG